MNKLQSEQAVKVAANLLIENFSKIKNKSGAVDVFLGTVRKIFLKEKLEMPDFLWKFCVKCGTYENVFTRGALCTKCSAKKEARPKGGEMKLYVYEPSEKGKLLGMISGETKPDLAIAFTTLAKKHGYTHWVFDDGRLSGTYINDAEEGLVVLNKRK